MTDGSSDASRTKVLRTLGVTPDALAVNEIYRSLQGESSWAGRPCVFVRLTACHLRCRWCDSEYTFDEGRLLMLAEVLERIEELGDELVEITGGEPLLQKAVYPLMEELLRRGRTVLLETSGSLDLRRVPERVHRIVDLKCPDSGEEHRNRRSVVEQLTERDELKFVIASRRDYEWARALVRELNLPKRCPVLMGVAYGLLEPRELAEWILADRLDVRFQLQMHKIVWSAEARGV